MTAWEFERIFHTYRIWNSIESSNQTHTDMTDIAVVDLYRTVKPSQLLAKFKYDNSKSTVTLTELFQNVPPLLLGSFRLDYSHCEVNLLNEDGTVMTRKIPRSYCPQYCNVKRSEDGDGISCWNWEKHMENGNMQPLPPESDDQLEIGTWYYLEAADIPNNSTVFDYLTNDPADMTVTYNNCSCVVLLSFKLSAGCHLPNGFKTNFDNEPPGHWTIRRNNNETFAAEYYQIGGNFNYGLVRELTAVGWLFQGIHMKACTEPPIFQDFFDKDMWDLAMIVYEYFGHLSSKELIDDACALIQRMTDENYSRELFNNRDVALKLMKVLEEIKGCCNTARELDAIHQFEKGLNADVINI